MGEDAQKTGMMPLIVSYYTKDPIYEEAAKRLEKSLSVLGLEHEIIGIDRFGDYTDHCCYKATFLQGMLEDVKKPVFWTDADNEFLQYPEELKHIETDVGVARFFQWDYELSTTVIYLCYNPRVMTLLKDWELTNMLYKQTWTADQLNFHRLVQTYLSRGKITVTPLPWSYCQSVDSEVKVKPVIWQHQASRRGREYKGCA